jgi:hypothetical protein
MVDESGGCYSELTVKIRCLPKEIDPFELYSGRDDVLRLRESLTSWYRKHRRAKHIAVLCPMGVGRWKENIKCLLTHFPDTTFEMHMTEDACVETRNFQSSRIRISPVHGLAKGWILRLIRLWILPPGPMILFTGHRKRRAISWLRVIFAHAAPLPATTMDHLVTALRQQNG